MSKFRHRPLKSCSSLCLHFDHCAYCRCRLAQARLRSSAAACFLVALVSSAADAPVMPAQGALWQLGEVLSPCWLQCLLVERGRGTRACLSDTDEPCLT